MDEEGYLNSREIVERLGIGQSTLFRWVKEERFPKPLRVGHRFSRWRILDVKRWEEEQLKAS